MHEVHLWSPADLAYLLKHGPTTPVTVLSRALSLPYQEVKDKLAELGISKGYKRLTNEALLEAARAFKAQRGYYPRAGKSKGWKAEDDDLCRELGMPNQSSYQRRFGSLPLAWAAAEGKPIELANVRAKKVPRELLLDYFNVYKALSGAYPRAYVPDRERPDIRQWRDSGLAAAIGMPLPTRYYSVFGGLERVRGAAARRAPNEDLLVACRLKVTPELVVDPELIRVEAKHQALESRYLDDLNRYRLAYGGYPLSSVRAKNRWRNHEAAMALGLPRANQVQHLFGSHHKARTLAAACLGQPVKLESYTRQHSGMTQVIEGRPQQATRKPGHTQATLVALLLRFKARYGHYPQLEFRGWVRPKGCGPRIKLPCLRVFIRVFGSYTAAKAAASAYNLAHAS